MKSELVALIAFLSVASAAYSPNSEDDSLESFNFDSYDDRQLAPRERLSEDGTSVWELSNDFDTDDMLEEERLRDTPKPKPKEVVIFGKQPPAGSVIYERQPPAGSAIFRREPEIIVAPAAPIAQVVEQQPVQQPVQQPEEAVHEPKSKKETPTKIVEEESSTDTEEETRPKKVRDEDLGLPTRLFRARLNNSASSKSISTSTIITVILGFLLAALLI